MSKAEELAAKLGNLEATGWGGDCFALTEYSEKQAELAAAELRRLAAEVESLRHALSFYADGTRYHGPNQPLDAPDKWSEKVGSNAYRLDVTRDGGVIARNALENHHG